MSVRPPSGHPSLARFRSRFRLFEDTLLIDEAILVASSVTASVDALSVEITSTDLYDRLMDADFFAARAYPTITFRCTRLVPLGDDHWRVVGDLTIRDIRPEIVLDTMCLGQVLHPFAGTQIAAFTAETAISCKDFDLTFHAPLDSGGAWNVGRVQFRLHIIPARVG